MALMWMRTLAILARRPCAARFDWAGEPHQSIDLEVAEALVAAGADVMQAMCADPEHEASLPLLHWAAYHDAVPAIKVLLAVGADVNVSSFAGMCCISDVWVDQLAR